ncbi:hypothetical protein DL768_009844 [Monosporascus sp. mg162]|nr:hypothetical protein DL768_009844 [Monosporascus sp. mg162]
MDASQQSSLFFKLFPLEIHCLVYEVYADDSLWTIKPIDLAEDDNRAYFRADSCSESPGDTVHHLQQDLDILFPDGAIFPAVVANIIFTRVEWFRFVPGEQKSLLGHYVEFLGSIHNLEKVKLRGFYHQEWLQFLEQELPGVSVEEDDEDDYSWDSDWGNDSGSDWDDDWGINFGSWDI